MLGIPVELVGADGAEGGEDGVEDYEVDIVPEIHPEADEEGEVGRNEEGVEVVEGFGSLEEGLSVFRGCSNCR